MKNSLTFVSKLISEGFKMEFNMDGCKVNDAWRVVVVEAWRDKNLYLLNVQVHKDTAHIANSSNESSMIWHERLGHLNMASLKELNVMVDGMNLKEVPLHHICEGCIKGKHQSTSFPKDGLHNFWRLSTPMCAGQWGLHRMVERDTFSHSLTISQGKIMFIFWRQKEKPLRNSNNTRHWWRTKLVTKSKCYNWTTNENLCPRNLMHFLRNVEFNNK